MQAGENMWRPDLRPTRNPSKLRRGSVPGQLGARDVGKGQPHAGPKPEGRAARLLAQMSGQPPSGRACVFLQGSDRASCHPGFDQR